MHVFFAYAIAYPKIVLIFGPPLLIWLWEDQHTWAEISSPALKNAKERVRTQYLDYEKKLPSPGLSKRFRRKKYLRQRNHIAALIASQNEALMEFTEAAFFLVQIVKADYGNNPIVRSIRQSAKNFFWMRNSYADI